jgi:hypothetical protein
MAKKITQATLRRITLQRKRITDLEAEVKAAEAEVTAALKADAQVAPGVLTAYLKVWERRNIAWKQIVVREKGEEFADRVFNATKPDKYESLVVEAVA